MGRLRRATTVVFGLCQVAPSVHRAPAAEELFEVGRRERPADEKALETIGIERALQGELFGASTPSATTRIPKLCASVTIVFAIA